MKRQDTVSGHIHVVFPMSVIPIFGMWVYNDKLQIKFTFRSGPMIFGRVLTL